MTVRYKTQAFVFQKEDRQEADRLFSVFTKDFGRLEILGKSIRKIDSKLRAGMTVFSFSQIEFIQGKHQKTLTDAVITQANKSILADPEKFEIAEKISGILHEFMRGQEADEKIWYFISDIFEKLGAKETNNKFLYYYFFWNFVELLGYSPQVSLCVECAYVLHPASIYFSNKEGGLMCGNHGAEPARKKINADAVKILRLILKKEWELLAKLKIDVASKKNLQEVSDSYLRYLLSSYS